MAASPRGGTRACPGLPPFTPRHEVFSGLLRGVADRRACGEYEEENGVFGAFFTVWGGGGVALHGRT